MGNSASQATDMIHIADDALDTDISKILYPPEYKGHIKGILISREAIMKRINVLAKQIAAHPYRPLLLCTLQGAAPFFQHLCDALQELKKGYDVDYIRCSSYEGTASSGSVQIKAGSPSRWVGRHVIVVEDIVDTGTTLEKLLPSIKAQSVQVCSLLVKRRGDEGNGGVPVNYAGFSIPDQFVIGYGLDYNEYFRDLRDICVISKQGIAAYAE